MELRQSIRHTCKLGKDPQTFLLYPRKLLTRKQSDRVRITTVEKQYGSPFRSLLQSCLHIIRKDYPVTVILQNGYEVIVLIRAAPDGIRSRTAGNHRQQQDPAQNLYKPNHIISFTKLLFHQSI